MDFKDNVAGYKEQFAIDPEISLSVAKRLNLRHHNAGKEPAVVTLDTLVYPEDESGSYVLSAKTKKEISEENLKGDKKAIEKFKRLKEKLLIEKKSSEYSGYPWFLTTDKDEFFQIYPNLEWMYRSNFMINGNHKKYIEDYVSIFDDSMVCIDRKTRLIDIHEDISNRLKVSLDSVKVIFAYCCWNKYISFDLTVKMEPLSLVDKYTFTVVGDIVDVSN
ncbi:TnsA endonuclease N-terminal domain-containing protein [Endozoicomonas sp.]|uniref:TnsA endonuclease N-terminal domain-containing protein n=1 Tax=Endozoicomonas sp. TaxID=1892382 RepID=UPI00383B34D0